MTDFPEWLIILFGILLILGGYRSIKTKEARTDAEFENRHGASAVRLGRFWIALGVVFFPAVVLDVDVLKRSVQYFLKHE